MTRDLMPIDAGFSSRQADDSGNERQLSDDNPPSILSRLGVNQPVRTKSAQVSPRCAY
jgi:hypothetical protein